jgi:hypothetical protein
LDTYFAGAITCCDPEIALALFVFSQGKAAGLLACYEVRSKGRAKRLLERDALAFCRGTGDNRNSQCAQCNHTRHYLYLILINLYLILIKKLIRYMRNSAVLPRAILSSVTKTSFWPSCERTPPTEATTRQQPTIAEACN